LEQFENCHEPLNEILKIMDKPSFAYDLDITPVNHVYYYVTATLYTLISTDTYINFNKTLHYLFNIMKIVYNHMETFDMIPYSFYKIVIKIIEAIHLNKDDPCFLRNPQKSKKGENRISNFEVDSGTRLEINKIIDKVADYLNNIIMKFDNEKIFSLNINSVQSSIFDSLVSLEKFSKYIHDHSFAKFNYINDNQEKMSEYNLSREFSKEFKIKEIHVMKTISERMLYKFTNIIKDLVDCKKIGTKIVMDGFTGFLQIENEEIVLYSIYRFMTRDNNHNLYQGN
jgi:hypothetical protein